MENKKIVLNELKDFCNDGYIFGDIAHFDDTYRYEDTRVGKAYAELSEDDELEVLEEYIRYRNNERANLRVR